MIQIEPTPNPNSLKFISEKTISVVGTEEFQKSKINEISNSFIKELLEFNGVELILLSKNFLSVKKTEDVSWDELKPMVISHINDYFEKNDEPILKDDQIQPSNDNEFKSELKIFMETDKDTYIEKPEIDVSDFFNKFRN